MVGTERRRPRGPVQAPLSCPACRSRAAPSWNRSSPIRALRPQACALPGDELGRTGKEVGTGWDARCGRRSAGLVHSLWRRTAAASRPSPAGLESAQRLFAQSEHDSALQRWWSSLGPRRHPRLRAPAPPAHHARGSSGPGCAGPEEDGGCAPGAEEDGGCAPGAEEDDGWAPGPRRTTDPEGGPHGLGGQHVLGRGASREPGIRQSLLIPYCASATLPPVVVGSSGALTS